MSLVTFLGENLKVFNLEEPVAREPPIPVIMPPGAIAKSPCCKAEVKYQGDTATCSTCGKTMPYQ